MPPTTVDEERERWIVACLASLCVAYTRKRNIIFGADVEEACGHSWCHGVVDVLSRAVGGAPYKEGQI